MNIMVKNFISLLLCTLIVVSSCSDKGNVEEPITERDIPKKEREAVQDNGEQLINAKTDETNQDVVIGNEAKKSSESVDTSEQAIIKEQDLPLKVSTTEKEENIWLSAKELEKVSEIRSMEVAKSDVQAVVKLTLNGQNLTEIPKEIRDMKNLQYLNIRNNNITTLPPWFNELKGLHVFIIEENNLTEFPEELLENSSIKTLFIGDNNLQGIPKKIYNMKSLEDLYIANNSITDLPVEISQCSVLRKIQADFNNITTIHETFASMTTLEEIHLRRNAIELQEARRLHTLFQKKKKMIFF